MGCGSRLDRISLEGNGYSVDEAGKNRGRCTGPTKRGRRGHDAETSVARLGSFSNA
jgi:hypothetical protein